MTSEKIGGAVLPNEAKVTGRNMMRRSRVGSYERAPPGTRLAGVVSLLAARDRQRK